MGLDYGSRTVGVAVSDGMNMMALPLETICRKRETKLRQTVARILSLTSEYDIGLIVIGLPLNMDDTEGERCEKTRAFAEILRRRLPEGIDIRYCDERLSTFEAEEIAAQMNIPHGERKRHVDAVAAGLILQRFMDEEQDGRKTDI